MSTFITNSKLEMVAEFTNLPIFAVIAEETDLFAELAVEEPSNYDLQLL